MSFVEVDVSPRHYIQHWLEKRITNETLSKMKLAGISLPMTVSNAFVIRRRHTPDAPPALREPTRHLPRSHQGYPGVFSFF